jgi:SPRY domain
MCNHNGITSFLHNTGWDKNSFGYHGDDGNMFCSSGTGQPYGPTFTTGDVIGCCLNLIDGTCFYTKNGINLGAMIAFQLIDFYCI